MTATPAAFLKTLGDSAPDYFVHLALHSAGASRLTAWRRAAGLCVADLAAQAGMALTQLLSLEAGQRASREERRALAQALRISPSDLDD